MANDDDNDDDWPRADTCREESELHFLRYWWRQRKTAVDPEKFTEYIRLEIMQKIIQYIDYLGTYKTLAWDKGMNDMVKFIPEYERNIKFLYGVLSE